MSPNIERLTFAWWNTGLSPSGKDRAGEEEYREAALIVNLLLCEFGVDCLALGEVTRSDLHRLLKDSQAKDYSTYDGTYREGKLIGDTGAIYSTQSLDQFNDKKITIHCGNRRLKVANRVDFSISRDGQLIHVFISHWPSHVQPDGQDLRNTLAPHLRREVDELVSEYGTTAPVLLMGDFNEEPFHSCIEGALLATRDRSLLKKHPAKYLYNPFWRHLGESLPYTSSNQGNSFAGTCVLKKRGYLTTWKTVDQVIVSSAFLGGSPWHLNEELTMILDLRKEAPYGYSSKGVFDHLPVIAVIDKVQSDGGRTND